MAGAYQCYSCGGDCVFHPKTGTLRCEHCGNEEKIELVSRKYDHAIEEYETLLGALPQIEREDADGHTVMECKSCGATMELSEKDTAISCPYCMAPIVLAERQAAQLMPDGILPFVIDRSEVQKIFHKWLKTRWLAPNSLKKLVQQGKVQSVYLPHWSFDTDVTAEYTADGGICQTESYENDKGEQESRTVTEWYSTSGTVGKSYDDLMVVASRSVNAELAKDINNFKTEKSYPYDERYMAGLSAERYALAMPDAYKLAKKDIFKEMIDLAEKDVLEDYDDVKNISLSLTYDNERYKQLLLPIYIAAYGFDGKTYQVLVNGETGKISGEYPKSYSKIFLLVAVIISVLAILYYMYA